MKSLRQYTNISQIRALADNSVLVVTDQQINRAEELIDAYCSDNIKPSVSARFYDDESVVKANFSNNIVTLLSQDSLEVNYLKYCTIEIIESTIAEEEGLLFPVINSNNLVALIDGAGTLTGQKTIRIYQLGKFPREMDHSKTEDNYYKTIPNNIRQASAYQAWFISENPSLFDNTEEMGIYSSESIGRGGQYSYSVGSPQQMAFVANAQNIINKLVAPQAKLLLQKYKIQFLG